MQQQSFGKRLRCSGGFASPGTDARHHPAKLPGHGASETPQAVIADAGYWHTAQIQAITYGVIEVLIPPDGTMREGKRPGWERPLRAHAPRAVNRAAASSTCNERS